MNPLEIISLIFAIIVLGKAVFVHVTDTKKFLKYMDSILQQRTVLSIAYLLVIGVLGYFLLRELTIVQIVPAMLLGMAAYILLFIQYPKALLGFGKEYVHDKHRAWLPWVVYIAIAIYVLIVLFA